MNRWPRAVEDRRRQTGYRVLFNKQTQTEAWHLARLLAYRLSPERVHQLRLLAEEMMAYDDMQPQDGV
jgi:hypothetical protein